MYIHRYEPPRRRLRRRRRRQARDTAGVLLAGRNTAGVPGLLGLGDTAGVLLAGRNTEWVLGLADTAGVLRAEWWEDAVDPPAGRFSLLGRVRKRREPRVFTPTGIASVAPTSITIAPSGTTHTAPSGIAVPPSGISVAPTERRIWEAEGLEKWR